MGITASHGECFAQRFTPGCKELVDEPGKIAGTIAQLVGVAQTNQGRVNFRWGPERLWGKRAQYFDRCQHLNDDRQRAVVFGVGRGAQTISHFLLHGEGQQIDSLQQ